MENEGLNSYKIGLDTTEQDQNFHESLKILGILLGKELELSQAVSWTQKQNFPDERTFALLGVA
jgi:hypothetical protein